MKTILTAAAVAALLVSLAPVATSPAFADGITLKRGSSTSTRTSRNRTGEEANDEAVDNGDAGNDNGGEDVADAGDGNDSGWSWGGGRNDDDEPAVRNDDARESIVLSRDSSRRYRRHRHRHGEQKRIWILNWW